MKNLYYATASDGRPRVKIVVWQDAEGRFVPESDELGMGHRYGDPNQAARDLARRHGYKLETKDATQ